MKLPLFCFTLLVVAPLLGSAQEVNPKHEPVALNFRYQAGKSYLSKMINKTSSKLMIDGQNMGTDQTMTMDFTIKVEAIEDSKNVKAIITYDRIAMKMNMMGQQMNFDSANPESVAGNPLGGLAGMAGKSLTATITPDMEFTDLKGVGKLFAGLGEGGKAAREMFSDEQLKQMMGGQVAAMIPDKKVKGGDEWPYKLTSPMGMMGKMTMEGKSIMKGVRTKKDSKFAVIDYSAKIKPKDQEGPNELGMAMEIKDGKMDASYEFDLAEGYVTESKTTVSMTLSMAAPGQEDNLTVPTTSTVTLTTKIR